MKKKKKPKRRNPIATIGNSQNGAGFMKDKRTKRKNQRVKHRDLAREWL